MIRARRAVVLAGGVFGTPQLLMLSGIGPGDHLREHGIAVLVDRPAVGANLQDHLDYVAAFETSGRYFLGSRCAARSRLAGVAGAWLRRRARHDDHALCRGRRLPDASTRDAPAPDIQLHFVPVVLEDHGRTKREGARLFAAMPACCGPKAAARCGCSSIDARDAPLIDPGLPDRSARHGAAQARRARDVPHPRDAAARRPPGPRPLSDRPRRRCRARTADPRTRRHDLSPGRHRAHGIGRAGGVRSEAARARRGGLYVADASIMPQAGLAATPTRRRS